MVPNEELVILTKDNLSIKDKMPGPKVSFIWRFQCNTIIGVQGTDSESCDYVCDVHNFM